MTTIQEIVRDPRYREFAAAATQHGKPVLPDAFPWNLMGRTDDEIMAQEPRYESGELIPEAHKRLLIGCAREQEELAETWWQWWRSWEWIAAGKPTPEPKPASGKAPAGMLFRRVDGMGEVDNRKS